MTPAVIGDDAVICGQSIEYLQENGYSSSVYSDHNSDIILMGWLGHTREIGMGTPQASTEYQCCCRGIDSVPYIGDADIIEPPVYGFCITV
jgi:hypothetical protein